MKVARTIAKIAAGELVIIGGIATYLHVQRRPKAGLPLKPTHDAAAAISALAMGLFARRAAGHGKYGLHKAQVIVDDVNVDLYPQHVSALRFSYADLAPYALRYRGFSIATIPHLLLLKLDALTDRGRSAKGAKDRRDVAKLLVLLRGSPQARTLLRALAAPADLDALEKIVGSPAFLEIARGNVKVAAGLRQTAQEALVAVRELAP